MSRVNLIFLVLKLTFGLLNFKYRNIYIRRI